LGDLDAEVNINGAWEWENISISVKDILGYCQL
jgi:hypothetical protein